MAFEGSDRFRVVGKLGEGGMGVVYEAEDRARDMRVALKALRNVDPIGLMRFKQEFRTASDLAHPNIVGLYELFAEGDDWFFTMELVPGDSFIDYVRGGRAPELPPASRPRASPGPEGTGETDTHTADGTDAPTPPVPGVVTPRPELQASVQAMVDLGRLRGALVQLAKALHALHEAGLVHRDLKPSNVRVTPEGRVVLMDFGIVADRRATRHGAAGAVGTPPYMAPEQALGDGPTAAADWYALGTMLFLALTGHLPFRGTRREILDAKARAEPPPPSALVAGVPDDLDQLCTRLLRRRAHRRPSGEEVLQRLGAQPAAPTVDSAIAPVFVGRELELAALRSGFELACRGRALSYVIEGESGMGKSALARRFLDELDHHRGAARPCILTGRCHERESLAYKAFDGIIDDLAAVLVSLPEGLRAELIPDGAVALARLFPVLRRVPRLRADGDRAPADPHEERARAVAALTALLHGLGGVRPVVLFIDDLQWADRDSLEVLVELLGSTNAHRLLFLTSVRSENLASDRALRRVVDELGTDADLRQLALGPLSISEQRELVHRLGGGRGPAPSLGDELFTELAESPLFLVELLRYLQQAGGEAGSLDDLALDDVLARRVALLRDGARRALEVMALAGEPLPLAVLADAAELGADDTERAVAELRVDFLARVARSDREPWLMCNHDRLRDVVVRELRLDRRRTAQRRLAEALERWPEATPENLARHWLAAGELREAITYLRRAADLASEKLAFEHAAELLEAAADLEAAHRPGGGADRVTGLRRLGEAMVLAGRCYDAAQVYERAAELAGGEVALELQRCAADNLLRSGHVDEGRAKLSRVLAQLDAPVARTRRGATLSFLVRRARLALRGLDYLPRRVAEIDPRDLARLDTMYAASAALGMVDHLRGAALQTRHLHAALDVGEERRVSRALAIEVAYLIAVGGKRSRRGLQLARDLLERADRRNDRFLRGVVLMAEGGGHLFAGRPAEATGSLARAEDALTGVAENAEWERVTARYFLALAQRLAGDYRGMAETTRRSLDIADRRSDLYAGIFFRCIPSTAVHLRADAPEEATRGLDRALDGWPEHPYTTGHYLHAFSRSLVDLYLGDGASAMRRLDDTRRQMRQLMFHRMPWIVGELTGLEIRAAILSGDRARARHAATRLARSGIPYFGAVAGALLAALADDRLRTVSALRDAAARFDELGAQPMAAACNYRLAALGAGEADGWFVAQGVVNPARLVALLLPLLSS